MTLCVCWVPVCFAVHKIPSEKESTLQEKKLFPTEANSFPFRVDHISEVGGVCGGGGGGGGGGRATQF